MVSEFFDPPHCIVYCRVPGPRFVAGLICTLSVCLSMVSFHLGERALDAYATVDPRAFDCIGGLVCYLGIWPITMSLACEVHRSSRQSGPGL